jgi:TonB family protein
MLAGLLSLAAVAAAASPGRGEPRWVVDWGDQRCSLIRETGGKHPVTMMVRTVPGAGQAELWLFDPQWTGPTQAWYDPIDVALTPSGFKVTQKAISVKFHELRGVAVTNLEADFLGNLPGSTSVAIRRKRRTLAEVATPNSVKAVEALRSCEAAIIKDWGLDPGVIQSLSRRPKAVGSQGAAGWFSSDDYPTQAVHDLRSGSVLTRMMVETDGRLSDCVVVESSGDPLLDRKTCELLIRRGHYEPALTREGAPTRAMTSIRIHWMLP